MSAISRKITRKEAQRALKHARGVKAVAARACKVSIHAFNWALNHPDRESISDKASKVPDQGKVIASLQAKARALEAELSQLRKAKVAQLPKAKRSAKAPKSRIRVVVPDSHGAHIDWRAANALIRDVQRLQPDEVVYIGDHLDCGGCFSAHQRNYTHEMTETYPEDCLQANRFLDLMRQAAPNSRDRYLMGNHEQHVERWCARNFEAFDDAQFALDRLGPEAVLRLKEREIDYFKMSECYDGLTTPGMIKLGKCYYTHGFQHSTHATYQMLMRVGANLVHGHTHRAGSVYSSTTTSYQHCGHCPGTIAKLQPLYRHTAPSNWTQGYIVQFENIGSGNFVTFQVPIFGDKTLLLETVDAIAGRAA